MHGRYPVHDSPDTIPLQCARFRFSIQTTSLLVLKPFKGGVLRGAFGRAFKQAVCVAPEKDCKTCLLQSQCHYATLFAPTASNNFPDAAKYRDAPRPFVLNPPTTPRQVFHPQSTLHFDVVLIGRAIQALPYFVYAFIRAGVRGLGPERGRFELAAVDLIRGSSTIKLYDRQAQTLVHGFEAEAPLFNGGTSKLEDLTLDFVSPLRMKQNGHLARHLSFSLFFGRLTDRIERLVQLYGNDPDFRIPGLPLLRKLAEEVEVENNGLHWYEWAHYSARQRESLKLGGLRGQIRLRGNLKPLMPYLKAGEEINVGLNTTFGNGRYVIQYGK